MLRLKLLFLNILLLAGLSYSAVYNIAEPDLLEEIEKKKNEAVKRLMKEEEKAKERMYSFSGVYLPPSKKNYVYYVDPTFTLQEDIPKVDRNGIVGILYKRGTKINPIDYMTVKPPPMIIFNACDERERFVVKKLIKDKNLISYMLVSTGCSLKNIEKNKIDIQMGGRPIYMVTQELYNKLQLKNTISFVDVDKDRRAIRIEVYKKDIN